MSERRRSGEIVPVRRRIPRAPLRAEVTCLFDGVSLFAITTNLSATGCFVETGTPVPLLAAVDLILHLSDDLEPATDIESGTTTGGGSGARAPMASRRSSQRRSSGERSLAEVRGRFIVREPKSARSRRRVEIPEAALGALRVYRGRRGTIPHAASLVFADSCGGYLRRSNVLRREWHPLLKRAGLPRVGFHAVRHGHATALLAAGANPRAIAERLGHSRASLVLDVYGHVIPGAGRELANRIAATLS